MRINIFIDFRCDNDFSETRKTIGSLISETTTFTVKEGLREEVPAAVSEEICGLTFVIIHQGLDTGTHYYTLEAHSAPHPSIPNNLEPTIKSWLEGLLQNEFEKPSSLLKNAIIESKSPN